MNKRPHGILLAKMFLKSGDKNSNLKDYKWEKMMFQLCVISVSLFFARMTRDYACLMPNFARSKMNKIGKNHVRSRQILFL